MWRWYIRTSRRRRRHHLRGRTWRAFARCQSCGCDTTRETHEAVNVERAQRHVRWLHVGRDACGSDARGSLAWVTVRTPSVPQSMSLRMPDPISRTPTSTDVLTDCPVDHRTQGKIEQGRHGGGHRCAVNTQRTASVAEHLGDVVPAAIRDGRGRAWNGRVSCRASCKHINALF